MRRTLLPLLAVLLTAGITTPARADSDASVTVSYVLRSVTIAGQEYVVAFCEASTTSGTSDDIPTQTGVVCSVNGLDVQSYGAGHKAFAVATHPLPRPVQFCYQGIGLLLDTSIFTYAVTSPRTCFTF